ncbi:NeuD/PglB/VioB family sugar acetyltransferase [Microbacterium sulfonylureivorans]|uniref:NeuD/PglB/VioB family sugar acetyltransferase n=1 Tax=Microbacterium sulfonylureivorans TaxID=2486854 RepID=UPI000FD8FD1C|nr:NeuD/PglB/VioB family sugar acetyltransferase [Microbacterium sulfonylureivorans]
MAEYVLLGGGGHARSVLAALRLRDLPVRGYLAPAPSTTMPGLAHLGGDEQLELLEPGDVAIVNGLGTTESTRARQALHEAVVRRGFTVAQVLHPRAFIDPGAKVAEGVQVLAGAVVNVGAELQEGALVNSGAIIEHDTVVGPHAHVAPGAVLAGGVRIGGGALVGLGARVIQGISVGAGSVVGAGAVVVCDIPAGVTVVGVPARPRADEGRTQ